MKFNARGEDLFGNGASFLADDLVMHQRQTTWGPELSVNGVVIYPPIAADEQAREVTRLEAVSPAVQAVAGSAPFMPVIHRFPAGTPDLDISTAIGTACTGCSCQIHPPRAVNGVAQGCAPARARARAGAIGGTSPPTLGQMRGRSLCTSAMPACGACSS